VRAKKRIDLRESGFDFSYLNVEESHGEAAPFLELAPGNSPVGGKPPKHNAAVEEFADGIEVLRREAPIDHHRMFEPVQGLNKGCRR